MSVNNQSRRFSVIDRVSALFVAVAATMWAADAYFRPALVQHLGSSAIVFLESLLISACFLPLAGRVVREARRLSAGKWVAIGVIALGPQAIATVLFTQSLSYKQFNETYLLYLLQPVFALLLARIVLRERRKPYFWPLAAIALVAVYFVTFPTDPLKPWASLSNGRVDAALFVIGAVALWGAGTVLGRYTLEDVSFVTTTALRFVLSLPVLAILLVLDRGPAGFTQYTWGDMPSFLGIALIPGFVAMVLYYRSLSSTPASLATLAELAYPVTITLVTSLPAPVGFGLPLYPMSVVGTVVLVAVVATLNLLKERDVVAEPRPHELRPTSEVAHQHA